MRHDGEVVGPVPCSALSVEAVGPVVLRWPSLSATAQEAVSDSGSRMGAAKLGQAASDALILTLRRSLTWADVVARPVLPVEHCVRIEVRTPA